MTYTLWQTPHSLYSGKARSYLLKKGLPFRELTPAHPRFQHAIVPVVGAVVIPVVETPEGAILQDTDDIIDTLEARHRELPVDPQTPVQGVVSMLFNAFGSNHLLALAMHYRWSYRAEQETFLRAEFGRAVYPGPDREARRAAGATVMGYFNSFLPGLGVTASSIPAMEASYLDLLDALDIHFQAHPYLLGGRPCRGDLGLLAPLYAHLARDPVPASLMKKIAPNVFRWTERMNTAGLADCDFPDLAPDWLAEDAIPETLDPVLRLVFADWGPGLAADAAAFDAWAGDRPSGTLVSATGKRRIHPSVGEVRYPWRGVEIVRASAPHGLWCFAKCTAAARALTGEAAGRWAALVARTGGAATMQIGAARAMKREDFALVLA